MNGGPKRKRPRVMSIEIVPPKRRQLASPPGGGETPLGLGAKLAVFRGLIVDYRRLPAPWELKECLSKRPPGGEGTAGI